MVDEQEMKRIITLVEDFISGKRQSLEHGQEIEVSLDAAFPDDDEIQDFAMDFASYRPGGADYLYGEDVMTNKCKQLLVALTNKQRQ